VCSCDMAGKGKGIEWERSRLNPLLFSTCGFKDRRFAKRRRLALEEVDQSLFLFLRPLGAKAKPRQERGESEFYRTASCDADTGLI